MNRRQLLRNGLGMVALATSLPGFSAQDAEAYSRDLYEEALASGEPFLLDFTAPW